MLKKMKAVLSSTYDDLYFFFLPIVAWSWKKIGVDTICFLPYNRDPVKDKSALYHAIQATDFLDGLQMPFFSAPKEKLATYAQCARLFGGSLILPKDEVLITADID